MYEELRGKKLLILGSSEIDANIVKAAQELGVYTIVADGINKSPSTIAKNIADESWDINYAHTREIGEKCKAENVDGVLAGYSEFRVSAACKIAEYIGSPFYATQDQIELTRNKRLFKDACRRYGIHVPKDYTIKDVKDNSQCSKIRFPVIVKPTDAAGRKGITICYDPKGVTKAVDYALEYSESGTVVIEEYVVGTEFVSVYTLKDGKYYLSCFNEKYLNQECKSSGLCDLALAPSAYMSMYIENADHDIKAFLKGIGAKNGVAFFQGIATEDDIYIFEMGYRLNGGNDYYITERENGVSYMKMLIAHSLTGRMEGDASRYNPYYSKFYANLLLYAHAGIIADIRFDGDNGKEGIGDVHIKNVVGSTVVENGTTLQGAFTFKLEAETIPKLIDLIHYCQNHAVMTDINGNNMLFSPFDTNALLKD